MGDWLHDFNVAVSSSIGRFTTLSACTSNRLGSVVASVVRTFPFESARILIPPDPTQFSRYRTSLSSGAWTAGGALSYQVNTGAKVLTLGVERSLDSFRPGVKSPSKVAHDTARKKASIYGVQVNSQGVLSTSVFRGWDFGPLTVSFSVFCGWTIGLPSQSGGRLSTRRRSEAAASLSASASMRPSVFDAFTWRGPGVGVCLAWGEEDDEPIANDDMQASGRARSQVAVQTWHPPI